MKPRIKLASLFLVVSLPCAVLAADPVSPPAKDTGTPAGASKVSEEPAPMFSQLDTNHDNYISKDEAKRSAEVKAHFDELDVNHDGKISVAEFKQDTTPKL